MEISPRMNQCEEHEFQILTLSARISTQNPIGRGFDHRARAPLYETVA